MAFAEDLLKQAFFLLNKEPKTPTQASLRRSVSTAYYALFHLLIHDASANWTRPDTRDYLARAFDHKTMKEASTRAENAAYDHAKEEQAMLNAAARRWASRGVVFLGVDEVDLRGPAKAYMKHYRVSYPSVYDGTGTLAGKFGVTGTPETFFIDRRGRAVPPHIIARTERAELDAGIRRALRA